MLLSKSFFLCNIVVAASFSCVAPVFASGSLTLFERLGGIGQIADVVNETVDGHLKIRGFHVLLKAPNSPQ